MSDVSETLKESTCDMCSRWDVGACSCVIIPFPLPNPPGASNHLFFAFRIAQKEARSRVRQPSENQRRPDFSISSYVYIYIKYVLIHKSYHISSSGFYIFYMFISVIPFGAFAFVFSMASDFFPCSSDEI
jgi:hypothetical protein